MANSEELAFLLNGVGWKIPQGLPVGAPNSQARLLEMTEKALEAVKRARENSQSWNGCAVHIGNDFYLFDQKHHALRCSALAREAGLFTGGFIP